MYVSIEGQGHFYTINFPGFVCFVFYKAKISGERFQDHWSSGSKLPPGASCSKYHKPENVIKMSTCKYMPTLLSNIYLSTVSP